MRVGERGEETKREVLFVGTDCGGERARLWVTERAQMPSECPGPARASLVQI